MTTSPAAIGQRNPTRSQTRPITIEAPKTLAP